MDFFAVSGHGETTRDNILFVVPEDTYLLFASQSGTTAPGENNEVAVIETGTDAARYRALFTAAGHGLQGGEYYFYEPGDLVPDYAIHFKNTDAFVALLGVYKLPMVEADFVGHYHDALRLYYQQGLLTDVRAELESIKHWDMLRDATPEEMREKQRPFQKWASAVGSKARVNPAGPEAAVMARVDEIARGGAENLVRGSISAAKQWTLRISDILRMPAVQAGAKRFFMMNFCRVSYGDLIGDYAAQLPVLLRALSESQKCSVDRSHALNVQTMMATFCAMTAVEKLRFLRERGGFDLVQVLKKVVRGDWKECLADILGQLTAGERSRLRSAYRGALTVEDLETVARVDMPETARLRAAVVRYRDQLSEVAEKKRRYMMGVYSLINRWLGLGAGRGLEEAIMNDDGLPIPRYDYLNLRLMRLGGIIQLMEYLGERPRGYKETEEERRQRRMHRRTMREEIQAVDAGSPAEMRSDVNTAVVGYAGAQPKDPFVDAFAWVHEANTSVPEPAPIPSPPRASAMVVSQPRVGPRNPWSNDNSPPPAAPPAPAVKRNPWSDENL